MSGAPLRASRTNFADMICSISSSRSSRSRCSSNNNNSSNNNSNSSSNIKIVSATPTMIMWLATSSHSLRLRLCYSPHKNELHGLSFLIGYNDGSIATNERGHSRKDCNVRKGHPLRTVSFQNFMFVFAA